MKLNRAELRTLVLETADKVFGERSFDRKELLDAVESHVRRAGLWLPADDERLSSAAGSKGRAAIDYATSDLHRMQKLEHVRWGVWKLAGDGNGSNGRRAGTSAAAENSHVHSPREKLKAYAGRLAGTPLPDEALDRESLY